MPNHVTNKIEFTDPKKATELLKKFTTIHKREKNLTYGGNFILKHKQDKDMYAWFNEKTGIYTRRIDDDITEFDCDMAEWDFDYLKEWKQFPDFEKTNPKPEGFLDVVSDGWVMPLENKFARGITVFEHITQLKERYENDENGEDILKSMENMFNGIRNFVKFGNVTWYSKNREEWGTKWNAYECKEKNGVYYFDTAWSSPEPVLQKMSFLFPDVEFTHTYFDEGWNFWGINKWSNGVFEVIHDSEGKELKEDPIGIDICKDLKNYDPCEDDDEE